MILNKIFFSLFVNFRIFLLLIFIFIFSFVYILRLFESIYHFYNDKLLIFEYYPLNHLNFVQINL